MDEVYFQMAGHEDTAQPLNNIDCLNVSQESSSTESNNYLLHQTSTNTSGYTEVMRVPQIKVKFNHNQMMPSPLPAVVKRVFNRRKLLLPQFKPVSHKPVFKLDSIKKEVNRVQMDIIYSANIT